MLLVQGNVSKALTGILGLLLDAECFQKTHWGGGFPPTWSEASRLIYKKVTFEFRALFSSMISISEFLFNSPARFRFRSVRLPMPFPNCSPVVSRFFRFSFVRIIDFSPIREEEKIRRPSLIVSRFPRVLSPIGFGFGFCQLFLRPSPPPTSDSRSPVSLTQDSTFLPFSFVPLYGEKVRKSRREIAARVIYGTISVG